MIALADVAGDDAPLIPPEIHDLYNKDVDMRKLGRQLCVLPDLLNSCPSWHCLQGHQGLHPGKHACRCTTAWLPACLVIEVDKLVRIYLTSPATTATGERSFSALRCLKTYVRWSTTSQQHLNNRMLLNVHKDLTDGLDLPTIARQFVDANEVNTAGGSLPLRTVHSDTHQSDWG